LIVLNAGLVMSGRSASNAFAAIKSHPIVTDALVHGAKLVMMPPLSCMSQVTDRGLTFADAAEGVVKGGHPRLSFFDQERVSIWWTKAVPAFIDAIPPLWLPPSSRSVAKEGLPSDADPKAGEQAHA
jgi:hypothetical protein